MVFFHLISYIFVLCTANNESMDFMDDVTRLKLRKSQFNLSVSLTPGELSAICDLTTIQPKSSGKVKILYFSFFIGINKPILINICIYFS